MSRKVLRVAKIVVPIVAAVGISAYNLSKVTLAPIHADEVHATRKAMPASPERRPSAAGFVAGNGLVEPLNEETKVASDVAGRVLLVRVTERQQVKQGDILLEFDHAVEDAALETAEAQLEISDAELARVTHGNRQQEVVAVASEAVAAKSRTELARGELARVEALARSGSISQAELDRARKTYEAEQATAGAAFARAGLARSGSRSEDVLIAQARVRSARARRAEAAGQLAKMIVRAPQDGEVLRVKIKPGEYYNPSLNQPLVLIGDTTRFRVRIDVDERDVASVKVGGNGYATAAAFGSRQFKGKVASVGRRMGRRTVRTDDPVDRIDVRILEVVLDLDDAADLVPGLRVTGFIESSAK